MSYEMATLGLVTLFYLFSWLPVLLARYQAYGLRWLLSHRPRRDLPPLPDWGQRAVVAQESLQASYAPFAVAILLLGFSGGFTPFTALAAWFFLLARLVHLPAQIFGMAWLRSFCWVIGFSATLYLLAMALVALL